MVGTVLIAVLIGLAVVLALLLALVATPVHLVLRAEIGAASAFSAEIRPFWGMSPAVRLHRRGVPTRPSRSRKTRKTRRRARRIPARFIRRLPGLFREVVRRVHLDRIAVDVTFGAGDPADTGQLYGLMSGGLHALNRGVARVALHPDFTRARFDATAEAALHVTPILLVWPVARDVALLFAGRL